MESHIKVLAILHIVFAGLGILAALIILVTMGGVAGFVAADHSDPDAARVAPFLGGLGVIISGFILVVSLPGLIGGIGLLKMAPWSRILLIVVSALELLNLAGFPLTTGLGIYGIWVLTRPEVERALRGNTPAAMASAR